MNKTFSIVITVIVVLLVVLIALDYSGVIHRVNPPASNSTSNSYAPNVVGTSDVNKSLGGGWTMTSSGHGSAGNINTFFNLLSGNTSTLSTVTPASTSVASPDALGTSSTNQSAQPFESISSFEFSVFSPNNTGFATVGYASFGSTSNANATFQFIYANVSDSSTANTSVSKGSVSGHEYVYASAYLTNTTLTPKNQSESVLIGIYGNSMIGIFYLTPINETVNSFTNLYLAQISKMSSMIAPTSLSVVVSGKVVSTNIGNNWTSSLGIDIQINNATSILHEFLGSLVGTANFTKVDSSVLNQTVGNLSEVALQGYYAGSNNATTIGFAKFMNDKVPYLAYTTFEASIANNKNATTGTDSANNASYVYYSESLPGYNNTTISKNVSVLFADYNDYVIYIAYVGNSAVTQSQFVGLLTSEINVI